MSYPIYVLDTPGGDVYRIDPDDGSVLWSAATPASQGSMTGVVDWDGKVWVRGREAYGDPSEVVLFDTDGTQLTYFTLSVEGGNSAIWPTPDGNVLLGEEDWVRKRDLQGNVLASYNAGDSVLWIEGTQNEVWIGKNNEADLADYDLTSPSTKVTGLGYQMTHVDDEGNIYGGRSGQVRKYDHAGNLLYKEDLYYGSRGRGTTTETRYFNYWWKQISHVDRYTGLDRQDTPEESDGHGYITTHTNGDVYSITQGGKLKRLDASSGAEVFSVTGLKGNSVATIPSDATDGPNLDLAAPEVLSKTPESITWTWQTIE